MILTILSMILLPLAMALLLLFVPLRPLVVRALGLAPLPALLLLPAAWHGNVSSFTLAGGWTFVLDQPGALMLGPSALLWIIAGFSASHWLRQRDGQTGFALWWLLTLSGSLGVFVAGDIIGFYALYALASLPAYGLIAFHGRDEDRSAGRITLAAALIGEGLILAAFVLTVASAPGQGLAIAPVIAALPQSPYCGLIVALVVLGFGLKIGLVPLHGWMPVSYSAGPLVATAVLSGATSKAGIIGLIRFLPLEAAMPVAGGLITAAGLVSAFYGALLGLTQRNPRSVLAYSSISQLGQMAAVLGVGLASGLPGARLMVAYYAAYHVIVKGGLFLLLDRDGRKLAKWQLILAGFVALGFAGLPLTGGALGKLAFKDVAVGGLTGVMLAVAAVGSTVLMLHFLRQVRTDTARRGGATVPAWAWIVAVIAATLLQWSLFAAVTGQPLSYALSRSVLFELSWPVAAGALIAMALAAAGTQGPRVTPGDVGAMMIAAVDRSAGRLAPRAVSMDRLARRWPVSAVTLGVALLLFVGLLAHW